MVTTSEEYRDVLKCQRAMSAILDRENLKGSEGAQVVRALVDAVRLKRDMRNIPDPRPADVSRPARKPRSSGSSPTPADAPTDLSVPK